MSNTQAPPPTDPTTVPPPSPAQANSSTAQQVATMEGEGQGQEQDEQPATDAPPTGGTSTPAADAHEAALDQEVDTFGVVTPETGPAS